MKKVKIEDIEYTIEALAPWQIPFVQKYLELAEKIPKSLEEAEDTGKELDRLLDIVLKEVQPKPKAEHKLVLFNMMQMYSTSLTQEIDLFRHGQKLFEKFLRAKRT